MSTTTTTDLRPWWILVGIAVSGLIALALMMVPQWDDWFYARLGRDMGTPTAVAWTYLHWQSLWAYLGIHIGALTLFGPFWGVRLQSLAVLAILAGGIAAVIRVHAPQLALRHVALASGGVLALGVVTSAAHEGLFWGSTVANYGLGTALCLFLWALGMQDRPLGWGRRIGIAALAAMVPGLSETMVVVAGGVILLGLLHRPSHRGLPWAYMALGLAIGLLPLAFSPGNAVRLASSGGWHPLGEALANVWTTMRGYPWASVLVIAVAMPTVLAWPQIRPSAWWRTAATCGLLIGTGAVAMLPGALGTGEVSPHVGNIGWYATCTALIVGGLAMGRKVASSRPVRIVPRGFITCLAVIFTGYILFIDLAPDVLFRAPARYAAWNQRDQVLMETARRGEAVALVARLPENAYPRLSFHSDLTGNPDYAPARHVAAFYRLARVWVDQRDDLPPRLRARWEAVIAADRLPGGRRRIAPMDHP